MLLQSWIVFSLVPYTHNDCCLCYRFSLKISDLTYSDLVIPYFPFHEVHVLAWCLHYGPLINKDFFQIVFFIVWKCVVMNINCQSLQSLEVLYDTDEQNMLVSQWSMCSMLIKSLEWLNFLVATPSTVWGWGSSGSAHCKVSFSLLIMVIPCTEDKLQVHAVNINWVKSKIQLR